MEEEEEESTSKMRAPWKIKINRFVNSWPVTLFGTLVTLYALFGDDIKIAFFPKSADEAFNIVTSFALGFFVIEITLNALTQ